MREKRISPLVLILSLISAILLTLLFTAWGLFSLLGKTGLGMAEAMVLIHTQFVGDCDLQKAADGAMTTLVTGLEDRWSYYVDAEGLARLEESQNNAYVGIGATISYPGDGGLYVIAVAEGGPSEQAGLQAGDTIVAVDGVAMEGEDRNRGSELTRGPDGTVVTLEVRDGGGGTRTLTVTRGAVYEHPVSYALLEDGTGLVTLKNFNRRCADEAIAAVDDLVVQGAERLVFDVRNNGGGYLDELTRLLDHLLPEGVIFRSSDKAGRTSSVRSDENCIKLPMAVLVNGDTYSAAEFFAAELQENDWGVIVGTPTFGKGYSQQTFPLFSGGAVNISTAKYFTGEGVSLIGTGLTLDREVALDEDQAALLRGHALVPAADPQLQAALALLGDTRLS